MAKFHVAITRGEGARAVGQRFTLNIVQDIARNGEGETEREQGEAHALAFRKLDGWEKAQRAAALSETTHDARVLGERFALWAGV